MAKVKSGTRWGNSKKRIAVIGSGIGGLASAALFAKLGHDVRVLEARGDIGGHARPRRYQGLRYCVGPQYVWHFNAGDTGDRFLKFLGIEDVAPFVLMAPDGFETVFVGDDDAGLPGGPLPIAMGLERFKASMIERFPEDKRGLQKIFRDMEGMVSVMDYFQKKYGGQHLDQSRVALDVALTREVPFRGKMNLVRIAKMPLGKWFSRYKLSKMCRKVLYAHGAVFAENEADLSALLYVFLTGKYHLGARLPSKGFDGFMDAIRGAIEREGGIVETGKRVTRLVNDHNLITGVECEDGTSVPCDVVFSDVAPRLADALLPEEYRRELSYRASNSLVMVCIGLVGRHGPVGEMRGRNYWWQTDEDVEYANPDVTACPTMLYVASHTANGYGNSAENNEDDGIVVGLPGNFDQETNIYRQGPEAVRAFKKQLGDHVLNILDSRMLPGLKEKLKFIEVVSSVDIHKEIDAERGNAYGRRLDVDFRNRSFLKKRPFKNLWDVSATGNFAGIVTGIETAAILMNRLTGERL